MDKKIKNCIKESKRLKKEIERLYLLDGNGESSAKLKELELELNNHEENIYAKTIFEIYSTKKPELIRVKTMQVVRWEDAFGEDFSKLAKSDKYALIGLFESGGKYKFK